MGFEDGFFQFQNVKEREEFLIKYILRSKKEFISYSIWSKLYKSDLIKNSYTLLQDDQQYGEDLFNLCLCILQSQCILLSKCALYHYVVKKESLSHLQGTKYAMKEIELNSNIAKIIHNYDEQIYLRLEKHICYYSNNKLLNMIERINGEKIYMQRFYYRNIEGLRGKRVAIYGAGVVGRDYYAQLCRYKDIVIAGWFDTNWQEYHYDYVSIKGIDQMCNYTFEKIIIAVNEEEMAKEIEHMLLEYGQPKEKIVWKKPKSILEK